MRSRIDADARANVVGSSSITSSDSSDRVSTTRLTASPEELLAVSANGFGPFLCAAAAALAFCVLHILHELIDTATGLISGTPSQRGRYGFTVQATNIGGAISASYSIRVRKALAPPS
jgi:hypothetical protein